MSYTNELNAILLMNNPRSAADWEICLQKMMNAQAVINEQIKIAFDTTMSLGCQMDTDFWGDYLHSPEDIDGSSTAQRWNKNTLILMQQDIDAALKN